MLFIDQNHTLLLKVWKLNLSKLFFDKKNLNR